MPNIKPSGLKITNPAISISLITIITVSLLIGVGHDTVNAGVHAYSRGFDVASRHLSPEGIWSDGETMWILDDRGNLSEIFAYRLSTGARIPEKDIALSSDNNRPEGITSDGTIMWVSDWIKNKLYAYDMETKSRVSDRDITLDDENDAPRGIAAGYQYVYVIDSIDRKAYAYQHSDGQYMASETFSLRADNDHAWGVWLSPESGASDLWVTDTRDDALYRYDRVNNTSSKAIRHPMESSDPRGVWSDGNLFWIVDETDDHVYAVVQEGFRQKTHDIQTTEPTRPKGIWTDGTTMWVTDESGGAGALLSYNLSDQSRADMDFTLNMSNDDPVAMWSDGSHIWVLDDGEDLLYAYLMNSSRALDLSKLRFLDSNNSHPTGIWSNGRIMWVADKSDDKLFAYQWPAMTRKETRDIPLASDNGNPRNIWSDGKHIWVLDLTDTNVYAYDLETGSRNRSQEFRPIPNNNNLGGGLTGHRQNVWMLDTRDKKIYGYAKMNVPASFQARTVRFQIHHSLAGGSLVGAVPQATDWDGDSLTYQINGTDSSRFTMDPQSGEIHSGSDATFTGGESLSFEATVHDGKGLINATDNTTDDTITAYVEVLHNGDPVFVTADGSTFTVAENVTETDVLADLDVSDPDGDTLAYEIDGSPHNPFQVTDGQVKLKAGETLDYETATSYDLDVRVRDGKDANGDADTGWDDEISITIEVTNVDEAGTVTLGSNNPEVNTALSASLTDPDGSVTELAWQWQKADTADAATWTDISGATAASYTPVDGDAGKFIRAQASYDDGEGDDKTAVGAATNAVLAEPPANRSPSFTEGASATRSVSENAQAGALVGSPVAATDPDPDDTLDYRLLGPDANRFDIDTSTGQISVAAGAHLNYEKSESLTVNVRVRDKKDVDGEDDIAWDAFIDVTINLTDVDESGTVEFTVDSPQVGQQISAQLNDPDAPVSNLSWQWQTADTADAATWTDVTDATTADYTPALADHGKYLRAQATYDDKHGTDKTAQGVSTNAIPSRPNNQAPAFNEGETATRSVSENAATGAELGASVLASDGDSDPLTYSLAAGADAASFTVDSATGKLAVAAGALLDFETGPSLSVVVQVSDGKNDSHDSDTAIDDTITVTINLVNEDEPGRVTLSTSGPEVDEEVVASLTDPDGSLADISWQWARSFDEGSNWIDLAGATDAAYTPTSDDDGALLRAAATYTDGQGSGKSAAQMSAREVGAPVADAIVPTLQEIENEIDTSLRSLRLSGISFSFNSATLRYSVTAPFSASQVTVTAVPSADSGVSVFISPADSNSSTTGHQVFLHNGSASIAVTVRHDESGESTTYAIEVARARLPLPDDSECQNNVAGMLSMYCSSTSFADIRVHHSGSYTIDWSKWDNKRSNVTGYTVTLQQFIRKTYLSSGRELRKSALANVYESCQFSGGQWNCEGPVRAKYHTDRSGQPTPDTVVLSASGQTRLGRSLGFMGVSTTQETFHKWSGDPTDPNNTPTVVTYRTKTSEVDRYLFVPHTSTGDLATKRVTIAGAAFAHPFAY